MEVEEYVRKVIADRARKAARARWEGFSAEDRKVALEPAHRARRKNKKKPDAKPAAKLPRKSRPLDDLRLPK